MLNGEDDFVPFFINNCSEGAKIKILETKGYENIKWINDPSEKIQLAAIKEEPSFIVYIKNPTRKVQKRALKFLYEHGRSIIFVLLKLDRDLLDKAISELVIKDVLE